MRDEIITLLKKMVAIPSVNSTPGEKEIGEFIEQYFREIPYFQCHPEYIFVKPLINDTLQRRSVIILIRGEKELTDKTIILHGHTDTVGVEDFGALEPYAFDCDKLEEVLKDVELPEEVRKDYESGDYLFGRGVCDMKCGDAVFMVMAKHICENITSFKGNLLLSFNPVEENQHTGIIESIELFEQIKKDYDLNYILAINNDYICPMYPGDTTRYIYTGAVGKVLPSFYIKGIETHVGQCFNGFDASMVASELIDKIHLNTSLCDEYNGEYTLPPTVLKCKDLKKSYNVQTAHAAHVYFNYFLHNKNTDQVLDEMVVCAKEALEETEKKINTRYEQFCKITNTEYVPKQYEKEVLTYEQLYRRVLNSYNGDLKLLLDERTEALKTEGVDSREISMRITELLVGISGIKHPLIVVFFAAPYCPHNTLKHEILQEDICYKKIEKIAKEYGKISGENYEINQFFPSLTDSSYLKIDDSEESIELLKNNFTQYEQLYNVPLEKMKQMNIPAINYGCYGKDAHKWTERVYIPYSFEVLPGLLNYTFEQLF